MHSDPIVVPARRLAGLAVRTSFARVSIDAGALWGRAIADGIVGAGPVVAAYTDYVGDHRGDYTMWVATELAAGASCPPALAELTVAAGRYVRFAADGDPAHAIARAWHHVWTEWPDRDRRSYRTDLELHGVRGPGTATSTSGSCDHGCQSARWGPRGPAGRASGPHPVAVPSRGDTELARRRATMPGSTVDGAAPTRERGESMPRFNPLSLGAVLVTAALVPTPARGDDGDATRKVINGDPVTREAFPSIVAVMSDHGNLCTGTLISPRVVLTAGHCVDARLLPGQPSQDLVRYVVSFRTDLRDGDSTEWREVRRVEKHDGFPNLGSWSPERTGPQQWDDIALVFLDKPVKNVPFQALALDGEDEALLRVGATTDVVGYGMTSRDSETGFGVLTGGRARLDAAGPSEILVGDQGEQQACRGDSGGPVLIDGVQVGIASRINIAVDGELTAPPPCVPGVVYTRVSAYSEWIRDRVEDLGGVDSDDDGGGCSAGRGAGHPIGAGLVAMAIAALFRRRRA